MIEISNHDFEFLCMHLEPTARMASRHAISNHQTNAARELMRIARKWNRRK